MSSSRLKCGFFCGFFFNGRLFVNQKTICHIFINIQTDDYSKVLVTIVKKGDPVFYMCITVDDKERLYKLLRCICVCAFICKMAAAETWPVSFQKEQFNKQNISDAISDGITSPGTITKTSVHCSDLHIQANKSFSAHLLSSTLSSNHVVLKRL